MGLTPPLAMKKRRQIEREFGVPIAGEILDPSLWTQTALLPPVFDADRRLRELYEWERRSGE